MMIILWRVDGEHLPPPHTFNRAHPLHTTSTTAVFSEVHSHNNNNI